MTTVMLAIMLLPGPPGDAAPSGDAVIRGAAGGSEIVITTTRRLAGAIHSLTWAGREFVDSADHGRQIQSASSFDLARPGFHAECFNPTEAGSRLDGAGPSSSSRLLEFEAGGRRLRSRSRMAFWLAPGERSEGKLALNDAVLSAHELRRTVTIGRPGLPDVIDAEIIFNVPPRELHTLGQFEALTGYMPEDFKTFLAFDRTTGRLAPLTDGPGEQDRPVALSTEDGRHAMAVYSADQPSKGWETAGYGRFRFPAERVVKWNCVFRERHPTRLPAGERRFRVTLAVGTRARVEDLLRILTGVKPAGP